MKFKMTQQCIDDGKPGNPEDCPVALLLKQTLAPGTRISVGRKYVTIGSTIHLQDDELHKWILRFDDNRPGPQHELIEFELPIEMSRITPGTVVQTRQ